MKVVVAPDSFKGTLSAPMVCAIVERSVHKRFPDAEVVSIPMADGGEGSLDCYLSACGGTRRVVQVPGPDGPLVDAAYGILPDGRTAVIEMAQAAGIALSRRRPMDASTFGVGELVRDAAAHGCSQILLCVGGSATVDGGAGMLAAFGCKPVDAHGKHLPPTPAGMARVADVRGKPMYTRRLRFTVACDVRNPLCGKHGAARVFGPQKGVRPHELGPLDATLCRFARILERRSGRKVAREPGSGAAGGIAVPLLAFYNTRVVSGVDLMLDVARFDEAARDADLVVTGEGRIDAQTLEGKVPVGVARRAARLGTPVIAVCGCVGQGYQKVLGAGIEAVFAVAEPRQKYEDMRSNADRNLGRLTDGLFYLMSMEARPEKA